MKVIIIGATSGIGRELAAMFVEAGHSVVITGRRQELLESFKQQYQEDAVRKNALLETACFDVRGKDNVHHLEMLAEKLGGVDLVFYNAGFGDPSPELDWETDRKTVDINVNGFIEVVNWAFRYFVRQGYGHIAATSSVAANRGNSFAPAYSASKAFMSCYLEGLLLKTWRLKVPIYITDIQPGFIKTKEINIKGQFWVVPLRKAAKQIFVGIEKRRFRVYISKRWRLIAGLMRLAPRFIYRLAG